jgi:inner membrane protein
MLLFAHVGVTLGAGILLDKLLTGNRPFGIKTESQFSSDNPPPSLDPPKKHLDYRFLLIGSLLPDLIDKPIGGIFFYQTFQNGRIFAHTLCFTILLALLGAYVYWRWKKSWFLILSFGSAIHLILDGMWLEPRTLLWPLYGWSFPKVDIPAFFAWLPEIFHILATEPIVCISELIGFAVLAWMGVRLIQTRKVYALITNGLVE